MAWADRTDSESAARRAGGRRRYNQQRRGEAFVLRCQIWLRFRQLVAEYGYQYGIQAYIARELGISQPTVCRALAAHRLNWQTEGRRRKDLRARMEEQRAQLDQRHSAGRERRSTRSKR